MKKLFITVLCCVLGFHSYVVPPAAKAQTELLPIYFEHLSLCLDYVQEMRRAYLRLARCMNSCSTLDYEEYIYCIEEHCADEEADLDEASRLAEQACQNWP